MKKGCFPVRLRNGSDIWLRADTSDWVVFEDIIIGAHYELPDYIPLRPTRVIDCGANIGISAVFFSGKWLMADIIAVEPDSENFEMLCRNIASIPRVTAVHAGIWPTDDVQLMIANPSHSNKWGLQTVTSADGQIATTTIPTLMARASWDRVHFLKLDVEGAERFLFDESCHQWLPLIDVIMIELHDRWNSGCSSTFYKALSRYDFQQHVVNEMLVIDLRRV